ncbi:lipoarabinomannan carrier protein LprG [Nocardiopsis tropica]|uniref:LppX_LprAFG lipoprotein n=1 Tax=Tsukamurella strandjordii TaxID=147577 RepID=UPI0031CDBA53
MKSSRPTVIAAAAALALTVTLTGCSDKGGGTGSETSAAASAVDAAGLVTSATDASKNVASAHFELATTGTIPDLPVTKVSGDLQNKPSVAAKGTARVNVGGTVEAKFVFIDGRMYADLTGGAYTDYGQGDSIYDVTALFDPAKGIPNILAKLKNPRSAGSETIDGQKTEKITGSVPASDIAAISGSRVTTGGANTEVGTTVWIQPSGDHQVVRISVIPVQDATLALTFSKWGEKVTVTKPDVAPAAPAEGGEQKSLDGN